MARSAASRITTSAPRTTIGNGPRRSTSAWVSCTPSAASTARWPCTTHPSRRHLSRRVSGAMPRTGGDKTMP